MQMKNNKGTTPHIGQIYEVPKGQGSTDLALAHHNQDMWLRRPSAKACMEFN